MWHHIEWPYSLGALIDQSLILDIILFGIVTLSTDPFQIWHLTLPWKLWLRHLTITNLDIGKWNLDINIWDYHPTKITNTVINILCTIFNYKGEGGSCDSGLWQTLTKVILASIFITFNINHCIYVLWSNKYFRIHYWKRDTGHWTTSNSVQYKQDRETVS